MLVKLELKFGFVQKFIVRMSSPFFAKPNVIGSKILSIMECNVETFELFVNNKCGMISMDGKEKQVYDTPKGDILFFYPSRNKMTLNKVVGRDKKMNMPIVQTEINEKEWEVKDNSELSAVLSCL